MERGGDLDVAQLAKDILQMNATETIFSSSLRRGARRLRMLTSKEDGSFVLRISSFFQLTKLAARTEKRSEENERNGARYHSE